MPALGVSPLWKTQGAQCYAMSVNRHVNFRLSR